MERGAESDPSREWTAPEQETGLEESVWGLELGGGEQSYPERPDKVDCTFYLRTGFCGYGSSCRYNHPPDRAAVMGAARPGAGEFPERVDQPVCQYYMRTGNCKFGASCKFDHPRQGGGSVSPVTLNHYGYPLRPGEKECSYYMKTGDCKFGETCKFHHPVQASMPVPSPTPQVAHIPSLVTPSALYPPVQSPSGPSSQQYGVVLARPSLLPGSYAPGPYHMVFTPGVVPVPGWSPYPAPVSPGTQPAVGSSSIYGMPPLSPSAPAYTGAYQFLPSSIGSSTSSQKESSFPERPGQPECQYYMKNGDCKFGSSCRYHHPPEVIAPKTNVVLSPIGLPLRPGAPPCMHYAQRGVCKFGPACRYDHSMGTSNYSPSASSLADMPVAPYPVGSSIGTLAPSFSSSELHPELATRSARDSASTRMSSSVSTSSESVGSLLSKTGPVPQSGTQESAQGSAPTGNIGGSSSTEAPTSN